MIPNVWSERQLFAFSGLDGSTDCAACFAASTMGADTRFGLRFHGQPERELWVDVSGVQAEEVRDAVVISDYIRREFVARQGELIVELLAGDACTVHGRVSGPEELVAKVEFESHAAEVDKPHMRVIRGGGETLFSFSCTLVPALCEGFDALVQSKLAFLEACPKPQLPDDLARTFAKCCSVLKVNVESAQGVIPCRWTTPDRWPHRKMWLWDSAFHALGYRHLDPSLAQDALLAVFAKQRGDGFIPHMMTPTEEGDSEITQPPVLAWATRKVYETSGDKAFLEQALPCLLGYLEWDIANRRPTKKWLFAWQDGDESGMDNSPRFDSEQPFYAVDFSAFMAHECEHVARMARELGNKELALHWDDVHERIAGDVNATLWNDEAGFYFDVQIDDRPMELKSVAALTPLLAGLADEGQAAKIAKHLRSPDEFARPFAAPSVAADEATYGDDMWRGPVWINYNYMIVRGLERAGQHALAASIREKTLAEISRWYHALGCIFEYYDAEGSTPPIELDRKGYKHDRRRMACIADYNWSAACYVDLVME